MSNIKDFNVNNSKYRISSEKLKNIKIEKAKIKFLK